MHTESTRSHDVAYREAAKLTRFVLVDAHPVRLAGPNGPRDDDGSRVCPEHGEQLEVASGMPDWTPTGSGSSRFRASSAQHPSAPKTQATPSDSTLGHDECVLATLLRPASSPWVVARGGIRSASEVILPAVAHDACARRRSRPFPSLPSTRRPLDRRDCRAARTSRRGPRFERGLGSASRAPTLARCLRADRSIGPGACPIRPRKLVASRPCLAARSAVRNLHINDTIEHSHVHRFHGRPRGRIPLSPLLAQGSVFQTPGMPQGPYSYASQRQAPR